MVIFASTRSQNDFFDTHTYYWTQGEHPMELPLLLNYCNHSPTGFEWGYVGSGPAQLAWVVTYMTLMIETEVSREFARATADLYHQGIHHQIIAGLPTDGWQISGKTILDWLHKQEYNEVQV